ncbi:MAG: hypothetical protein NZ455_11755 [Bacteroidia bacterium]|nr:hypothetical protein [Bacteroidia bacterium]MDW8346753.1 hypothetical protein [Bacteroidia bacterium]
MNYLDQFQIEKEWQVWQKKLNLHFAQELSLEGVLLFIGIRELGWGRVELDKELKTRLIDIGICAVLSQSGYFSLQGKDENNFPIYQNTLNLPKMSQKEQEVLLKQHIIAYLKSINF